MSWHEWHVGKKALLTLYLPTLTPAHAYGPVSHAWLKNVSYCRLAWHNFQKYVNSDPCKERKPYVKWINDNTFLAISDFVDKRFLYIFAFGRTSDVFRRLRTSLGIFGNDRVVFKNPSTPRIKISRLYLRKSWQVYNWTVHTIMRALKWLFFSLLAKTNLAISCVLILKRALYITNLLMLWLIGNRTSPRPIWSVIIILVIKQIGLLLSSCLILLITSRITDRIGLHTVPIPLQTHRSLGKLSTEIC